MGKSTRKALRRTPIHNQLAEGVRDLIRLYNLFKNKQPFIPEMKDFLKRITRENLEYKEQGESSTKKLVTELKISEGDYFVGRRHLIHFNNQQKMWLVRIMDLLQESIAGSTIYHFFPIKWVYRAEAFVQEAEPEIQPTGVPNEIIEEGVKGKRLIPERLIRKQAIETLQKKQLQIQEYPLSRKGRKQVEGSKTRVGVISVPYTVYEVMPVTEFGHTLLWTESIIDNLEHPIWDYDSLNDRGRNYREVPSINFYGISYFLRIVRSLLVNYHIVFGNFEYIKVCEWCTKLFLEQRKGRGRFCSKDCKRKFKQASPKFKCWNRQNTWIGRQVAKIQDEIDALRDEHDGIRWYNLSPTHVSQKEDCKGCGTCKDSGTCPALMKKNEKVFSILKALPDIQKEFSKLQIKGKGTVNERMKEKDLVNKVNGLLRGF